MYPPSSREDLCDGLLMPVILCLERRRSSYQHSARIRKALGWSTDLLQVMTHSNGREFGEKGFDFVHYDVFVGAEKPARRAEVWVGVGYLRVSMERLEPSRASILCGAVGLRSSTIQDVICIPGSFLCRLKNRK